MPEPLPTMLYEPLVRAALAEDLGRLGDLTGNATIPADRTWQAVLRTRKAGVIAGLEIAACAFRLMDPTRQSPCIKVMVM